MKAALLRLVLSCALIGVILSTGCATATSGVMQISADTFMISKTSRAGAFANQSAMQAEVIRQANEYAASKGKIAVARGSRWERPNPGFPTYEYQFILVDKDDPRAAGVSLQPAEAR